MPATIFQGDSVKALKDKFKFKSGEQIINSSVDPINTGVAATKGSICIYGGMVYKKNDDSTDTNWELIGKDELNFLHTTGLESGITGYDEYADADQATPEDGTGGSPNVVVSQETSSPLVGEGSLKLVVDAADRRGEGFAYAFLIPDHYRARLLTIRFEVDATDANYDDGDLRVFVYDVTNSNLIYLSTDDEIGGGRGQFVGQFQTAADSSSYRLIIHVASENTDGYSVYFDEFKISPTPSVGYSSGQSLVACKYSGDGATTNISSLTKIPYDTKVIDTHGAYSAGTFTVPETGQYYVSASFACWGTANGANDLVRTEVHVNDTSVLKNAIYLDSGTNMPSCPVSGVLDLTKGDTVHVEGQDNGNDSTIVDEADVTYFSIHKISSCGGDSDVGNSDVVAIYQTDTADSMTNGAEEVIYYDEKVVDTHGAVSATDFASQDWVFTTPATGYYQISASHGLADTSAFSGAELYLLRLYKNGTEIYREHTLPHSGLEKKHVSLSTGVYLVKGDTITLKAYQASGGDINQRNNNFSNRVSIIKVSSSKALIGQEFVGARYEHTSGQTISGVSDIIDFDTKDYDSHNAVTTGASWRFTVPSGKAGKYLVTYCLRSGDNASADNKYVNTNVRVNGTGVAPYRLRGFSGQGDVQLNASVTLDLAAGDYVDLLSDSNWDGTDCTLTAVADYSWFEIFRIG